ncbi:hypothetical protein ACQP1W_31490 [Spirillospora sp. CA-255316]
MTTADELLRHRTEMGQVLGLDEPVPEPVLHAALADRTYANNLLAARRSPDMLRLLLAHPPSGRKVPLRDLLAGAAGAFGRWAATGFTVVDEATRARRTAACAQCPELTGTDRRLLHGVATAGLDDKSVCGLCGCPVARKVRLPSERCPARHPDLPGRTRWDEPAGGAG